jgi:hypothetical protein
MPNEEIEVRYTFRIEQAPGTVYAECLEAEVMGEGRTREEAVESLRDALRVRLQAPDAVAPPSVADRHRVVLVEADPPPRG